jgi:MFS family permease
MLRKFLGEFRLSWISILLTYFCYGASTLTGIADVFFQKEVLMLTPAEVAGIGFWLGLPWSMKMVVGAASDVYPLFGSRRAAYLLIGTTATLAGYLALATSVDTKSAYLGAWLLITIGFMMQDVVADALSVEVAETEEEIGQIQALGRIALLLGGISVGYLSGWLAGTIGARGTYAVASILPLIVAASVPFARRRKLRSVIRPVMASLAGDPGTLASGSNPDPLGGGKAKLVMLVGLGYAALGVALELLSVPFSKEIILVVSLMLIGFLLQRVGIVSHGVITAALVIFLFRATPSVGQGYTYWAIEQLGFDQEFLGVLAQVSAILSLVGLLIFRKPIVTRPVSFTLFWVIVAGTILYLPTIGLFYGFHNWLGISARTLAFIDTTITAPLAQITMVPMLILIARSAPPGAEATMFAIMASLMNLALSASQLFTGYLNELFRITQHDFSNLGMLMITVTIIGFLPVLALPVLRRTEQLQVMARTA